MYQSKYFSDTEVGVCCPCGCKTRLSNNTLRKLDAIREEYGQPIYLASGATCLEYSLSIGRKKTSKHIGIDTKKPAIAVDIARKTYLPFEDWREGRMTLKSIAFKHGAKGFGLGVNGDKRLHIDFRDKYAEWFYNC